MDAEQFGQYVLLRRIAKGGMGELFLAQRAGARFSTLCVVKRIRSELIGEAGFVEMFLDEGRVAALIDHPNVVRIQELGEVSGTYFMTMEYVAGQDLGALLERLGGEPLDLAVALQVFGSVCEGLAFAHDALGPDGRPLNLVHRDINPHNILISYAGAVKLSDFGIAKVQLAQRQKTRVGVLKGKFGYLSPEQAQGREVDRRSDIYALGLLLYEITTGQRAITGTNEADMLFAAADGIAPRPSSIDPHYPPALEEIYRRATARRIDHRYQTVGELRADLMRFQLAQQLIVTSAPLAELMQTVFAEEWRDERRTLAPVVESAPSADAQGYEGYDADAATVTTLVRPAKNGKARTPTPARGSGAIPIEVLLEDFANATAAEKRAAYTQAVSPEELVVLAATSPTEQLPAVILDDGPPPREDLATLLERPKSARTPAPLPVQGPAPIPVGPEEPTQIDDDLLQTNRAQRKARTRRGSAPPLTTGPLRPVPSVAGGHQLPPPSTPGSDEEWWDSLAAHDGVRGGASDVVALVSDSPPPAEERAAVQAEPDDAPGDEDDSLVPPRTGRTVNIRGRGARRRRAWPFILVGLLGLGAGAGTYTALVWHNGRGAKALDLGTRRDARPSPSATPLHLDAGVAPATPHQDGLLGERSRR